jgi:hypothetical protein
MQHIPPSGSFIFLIASLDAVGAAQTLRSLKKWYGGFLARAYHFRRISLPQVMNTQAGDLVTVNGKASAEQDVAVRSGTMVVVMRGTIFPPF